MATRKKKNYKKSDHYQEVTDMIIAKLEEGVVPWVKPWSTIGSGPKGMPVVDHNAISGTPYNGVNIMMLWMKREEMGYESPGWISFNKCKELGGSLAGQKGTKVLLWKPTTYTRKNEATGKDEQAGGMYVRWFTVFNLEQCTGLPEEYSFVPEPVTPEETEARIARCEEFAKHTEASISHGGDRAFYKKSADTIRLPKFSTFKAPGDYYSTLFHELTHWTGHEKRCERKFGARFGDMAYAAEELVAEMGAAFLCASHGIDGKLQHENYIEHWLKVLKEDNKAIITAAARAKDAVKHMEALQPGAKETTTTTEQEAA